MLREKIRKFHFVGIGGIGMSGIAKILLEMGYEVSGSDIKESETVETLRRCGAKVYIGHSPENIKDAQVVVYSSAISQDNPEIVYAKKKGIPVIPRGEMLAEIFRMKEGIAVSGSHGKTTTTSMIASILTEAGYDPTVIIGGVLQSLGGNAKLGKGDLIVSEADESDGSFLKINPVVAVITNIDEEHLDFYGSIEEIKKAFLNFADRVPFYGFTVANIDDKNTWEIIKKVSRRVITFGIENEANLRAKNLRIIEGRYAFDVYKDNKLLGTIHLNIPGKHNVYNALASIAVSLELDVEFKVIKEVLESFKNVKRRLEFKGIFKGAPVYDDYGHHPTEIKKVIESIREMYPERKLVLIFQPHRYSRTYYLFDKFVEVLKLPDITVITDIYPAGEKNVYGVNAEYLARKVNAYYIKDKEGIFTFLEKNIRGDEVITFMGAGNITKWCSEFIDKYAKLKA